MRTVDQMIRAALDQHRKLIDEGKDTEGAYFKCTPEEHILLLDAPAPKLRNTMNYTRDRICGLGVDPSASGSRE